MHDISSLENTFEKHKNLLGRKELSRAILNHTGKQQRLVVSIEEAEYIYSMIHQNINEFSPMYQFIKNGVDHVGEIKRKNGDGISITANAAHQMTELLQHLDLHRPEWLPNTFFEENTTTFLNHRFIYYFLWDSVRPDLIAYNERYSIELAIERYAATKASSADNNNTSPDGTLAKNPVLDGLKSKLEQTDEKPSLAAINIATAKAAKAATTSTAQPQSEQITSLPHTLLLSENGLPDRIKLSLLATRQYLYLYQLSLKESVPFGLTVDDLMEMLRTRNCHFTNVLLAREPQSDAEPGENHVAVARLTNAKGYVPGNVVICSQQALAMKGNLDHDVFEQTMNALRVLQQSGLPAEQVRQMLGVKLAASA